MRSNPKQKRAALVIVLMVLTALCGCGPSADALIAATEANDVAEVKRLIAENPEVVRATGNAGMTALHWAAAKGYVEVAQVLIDANADINYVSHVRETPLDIAVRKRRGATEKLLRENGGKIYKDVK